MHNRSEILCVLSEYMKKNDFFIKLLLLIIVVYKDYIISQSINRSQIIFFISGNRIYVREFTTLTHPTQSIELDPFDVVKLFNKICLYFFLFFTFSILHK